MSLQYRQDTSSVNHASVDTSSNPQNINSTPRSGSITNHSSSTHHIEVKSGGKTRITCPITVVNGLDFLKVSLWLNWHSNSLLKELEALKTVAQAGDESCITFHAPGGFDWNLYRTGTSRYNYRLTSGDLTLLLNTRKSDGVVPNARFEIGSLSCWSPGFFTIYERVVRWLKLLDAEIVREVVSEVHLTADFINRDIQSLGIDEENRWVSRTHKFNIHRHRRMLSGIILGKGNLMLRIYDKVLELQKAPHKQAVFSEIWKITPYNKHPVTRVEFQLRRPVLLEFENKIETVKSLLFSLQAVWEYCTHSWARFCQMPVNRNHNQSKATNSPFWEDVSSVTWAVNYSIERKKRRPNKNIDQIRANMRGLAMTYSAFYDAHPEDLDQIIGLAQKALQDDLIRLYKEDPHKFVEQMKRKSNEIYTNI